MEQGHEGGAVGGYPACDVVEEERFTAGELLFVGRGARRAYVEAAALGGEVKFVA